MIGLFWKRALQKRQYSANKTYNLIDPTNRSHPVMNEAGRAWMSHVTHEWVISQTYEWAMLHISRMTHSHVWRDSFTGATRLIHMRDMTHSHVWRYCYTYPWDISCQTCLTFAPIDEWGMPQMWRSRVTHSWMSHVTHVWISHVAHIRGCDADVWNLHEWHASFICAPWLIHKRDLQNYTYEGVMSHIWMSHVTHMDKACHMCDSFVCVTWLDSFICVTWLIHMCDMVHSHVWHDSCRCHTSASYPWVCLTWLIHVWHDSFICVTWFIHMCDITHSDAKHLHHIRGCVWHLHLWMNACDIQTRLIYRSDSFFIILGEYYSRWVVILN